MTTARLVWEGMLTELSKVNAPSMLLQDFNYFFNKAINQYINKRYNIYDVNQQTTDDLRVLKATSILDVKEATQTEPLKSLANLGAGKSKLFGATYEVNLPKDYLHILNCICIYRLDKNWKCYNKNDYVQFAAKRLTADSWSVIINDYYNRPLPERPYFYIHNINTSNSLDDLKENQPLQPSTSGNTTIDLGIINPDEVIGDWTTNHPNTSNIRMEIRYGLDNSVFILLKVLVDYIKSPLVIRLTLELVNLTEDTSQVMEFPDYVCQEIINELTTLVMENTADPRLLTNLSVSQSIANPAQQLTPQPQPQLALAL